MDVIKRIRNEVYMKVTEILKQDKPTISFEVFPPKRIQILLTLRQQPPV